MGDSTAAMSQRRWSLVVLATVLFVGAVFVTIYPLFRLRYYLPVYDRFAPMLPIVFAAPIPVAVGYAYVLTRRGRGSWSVAPARVARGVAAMLVTAPLLLLLDTPVTTTLSYALYGLGVGLLGILSAGVLYNSDSAA